MEDSGENAAKMDEELTVATAQRNVSPPEVQSIDFMTFGMFIIDDIEYQPPKKPVNDVLGGAGSYAALGARLFSPPPLSKTISFIVDRGSDFPQPMSDLITSWQTSVNLRVDPSRLTTRAWNGYSSDGAETRSFKYTTPKLRLLPEDLTPAQVASKSFHIVSSPARCKEIVESIHRLRRHAAASMPELQAQLACRPFIIWEPIPDLCVPDELLNVTNNLPIVDVCSPNHAELAALMGDATLGAADPETGLGVSKVAVERASEQLLASMPLQSFALVVRCGEAGCFVTRNGGRKRGVANGPKSKKRKKLVGAHGGLEPDTDMMSLFAGLMQDDEGVVAREEIEVDPGVERWIPAYHRDSGPALDGVTDGQTIVETNGEANGVKGSKVVDPTGGGNAFLGGLCVALARGKTVEEAAIYGSVAASFAIEQVGVPVLGEDDEGNETWNGVRVEDRLKEFEARCAT